MAHPDPHPLRFALLLYFAFLAAAFVIPAATFALYGDSPRTQVLADFVGSAGISLITLIAVLLDRGHVLPLLARRGPWSWYALAPLLALGTFALATAVITGLSRLINLPILTYAEPFLQAGYPAWLPFLMIAVHPAVFEELAFRGVIAGRLRRLLEPREAFAVTALLFATIHLSPVAFAHLLIVGLVLGWVRERSGSLYPAMLLHGCHNACVVASELLAGAAP